MDVLIEPLINSSETLCRNLDGLNSDLLSTLLPGDLHTAENMLANMEKLLHHGGETSLTTRPGTAEHQLVMHLGYALRQHPAAGFLERGRIMADFIGAVISNDYTLMAGNTARRMANVISVATRTGTIVALTTLLRQLIGFSVENNFRAYDAASSLSPRVVAAIASMLIGPGLNLAGAIRDERNGAATASSRASRIAMGLLSAGGLMLAIGYRPSTAMGPLMGSFCVQTAAYTLSRDLIQLFFPLHDNGGFNTTGLIFSSLFYGLAQWGLGELMEYFAPQSGAGYAMAQADRAEEQMTNWAYAASITAAAIKPNLMHDLLRSALNSLAEIFDDLQRPALMRFFAGPQEAAAVRAEAVNLAGQAPPADGVRIGMDRPRIGTGSWPTAAQVADQFLTVNAMRTSMFEAIVSTALTVAAALDDTRLAKEDRALVVNSVIAGLVIIGYPGFIGANLSKAPCPKEQN
ncbi:hypothetical protein ACL2XP_21070 [Sodalis sp. RH21]|uniref:hypothetical protein n=1 Tax=unclassified Sodalis (in: enterobacteria) TaxID=2636512 RepID=UPI0039B37750